MAWYDVTGTVPDWIMAGAAGYAAYMAKNWFKPNLQQQGLPKVVEFLQKDLLSLVSERLEYIHIDSLNRSINAIEGDIIYFPGEKQKRLNLTLEEINKEILPTLNTSKIKSINHFDSLLSEFKWYGYYFKEDKHHLISEFFKLKSSNRSLINAIIDNQKLLHTADFREEYLKATSRDQQAVLDRLDKIKGLNLDRHNELQTIQNEIKVLKKEILNKNFLVTDFFELKK